MQATGDATGGSGARARAVLVTVGCVAGVEALGAASALFVEPGLSGWYRGLAKPAWTPPDLAFPLVWTALYACMGVTLAVLWRARRRRPAAARAIGWFAVQLAVNLAYAPVFFGLRSTLGGLVVVVALLAVLVPATLGAWRTSVPAGALYVPYLAWVLYAVSVSAGVWLLNP